jgi:hypothetical protein
LKYQTPIKIKSIRKAIQNCGFLMVFNNDLLSSKKMKRPGKYMNAGGPLVRNAQEMNREEYNSA